MAHLQAVVLTLQTMLTLQITTLCCVAWCKLHSMELVDMGGCFIEHSG
jgi:hypothetical protein